MKIKLVLFLFCLASGVTLSLSESEFTPQLPHAADESFSVGYIQMLSEGNCSYMVVISTSCSSPKYTADEISIVFGDAYGHQVYAPRLNNPISGTFEKCSSDHFQIDGPCASQICYVYLYRSGSSFDGWKPESVKIYGTNTDGATFDFNTPLPNGTWYGYNLCETPKPPSPPSPDYHHPPPPPYHPPTPSSSCQLSIQKWLAYVVIGFVLGFWM